MEFVKTKPILGDAADDMGVVVRLGLETEPGCLVTDEHDSRRIVAWGVKCFGDLIFVRSEWSGGWGKWDGCECRGRDWWLGGAIRCRWLANNATNGNEGLEIGNGLGGAGEVGAERGWESPVCNCF